MWIYVCCVCVSGAVWGFCDLFLGGYGFLCVLSVFRSLCGIGCVTRRGESGGRRLEVNICIYRYNMGINKIMSYPAMTRCTGTLPGMIRTASCGCVYSSPNRTVVRRSVGRGGLGEIIITTYSPHLRRPAFHEYMRRTKLGGFLFRFTGLERRSS